MENQSEIIICLGSSCFARGNKGTLKVIQDFLKENNLNAKVHLHGERCFGHCAKGPVVKIDEVFHESTDEQTIIKILEKKFF
jgi:NADH:ubiquinone oxidoreductase subunit E